MEISTRQFSSEKNEMEKEEFNKINELENSHWWYVGTREISFSVLFRYLPKKEGLKILDIGCGTGGNLKELSKFGEACGIDLDPYVVGLCKQNGFKCEVGDLRSLQQKQDSFDLITLFDVLNQVDYKDIPGVLNDINSSLKKGGLLIFREPAIKVASGKHDLYVNIKFRSEEKDIRSLLEKVEFKILYSSHINFLLFFPVWFKRKVDFLMDRTPRSDIYKHSDFSNKILLGILRAEKYLLNVFSFPIGTSLLVVAKKS